MSPSNSLRKKCLYKLIFKSVRLKIAENIWQCQFCYCPFNLVGGQRGRKLFVRLFVVANCFSSTRIFFRRPGNFGKDRSPRRDQNRPRIVEVEAIHAIFEPFEVLRFDKISTKKTRKIHMPLFDEFSRSSRDLYRNPLRIELSPGRLSKFFQKWRVRFSGKSGC